MGESQHLVLWPHLAMFTTTVQSTLDYLAVAIEDDGSNKESLTTEQFGHLLATIPHLSDSSADGTKAIAMLKVPGLPFSAQQLKELRGCLASVSKPRGNNSGPSASAAKKTVLTTKRRSTATFTSTCPKARGNCCWLRVAPSTR